MLSSEERYHNFKSAIEKCGCCLKSESNDVIEYNLFEEFLVDAVSFLHENTLHALLDEGMIDCEIFEKSAKLRSMYLEAVKNADLMNAEAVRTSEKWGKILAAADEIRALLYW